MLRVGQERHQVVGKCGQVAEQDADGYLQQVFQLERAPQQDDLQQLQPHVKEDGGFAHFDAPHAGHGVRDRADRRHAQVGFNGNGDPQRHDEEPRHVHQESHENTGFFRFLLHFYASLF